LIEIYNIQSIIGRTHTATKKEGRQLLCDSRSSSSLQPAAEKLKAAY